MTERRWCGSGGCCGRGAHGRQVARPQVVRIGVVDAARVVRSALAGGRVGARDEGEQLPVRRRLPGDIEALGPVEILGGSGGRAVSFQGSIPETWVTDDRLALPPEYAYASLVPDR